MLVQPRNTERDREKERNVVLNIISDWFNLGTQTDREEERNVVLRIFFRMV